MSCRRRTLGGLAAVLVAAAGMLGGAGTAGAATGSTATGATVTGSGLSITASVDDAGLRTTGQHHFTLTLTLRIVNGTAFPADVSLTVGAHPWPHHGAFGFPVDVGPATLTPPATFLPIPQPPIPPPLPGACVRGDMYDFGGDLDVELPPASGTTVTVPLTAIVPSWPDTDYTPMVVWSRAGSTSIPALAVAVPPVSMPGPSGVLIRLSHVPPGQVAAGAATVITGSTDPPLAHRTVILSARHFGLDGSRRRIPVGRVTTDAAGRFTLTGWRPERPGVDELIASVPRPGRGLVSDSNCAQGFTVTAPAVTIRARHDVHLGLARRLARPGDVLRLSVINDTPHSVGYAPCPSLALRTSGSWQPITQTQGKPIACSTILILTGPHSRSHLRLWLPPDLNPASTGSRSPTISNAERERRARSYA
jgi:hypothetical protein